jgi:delta 1-pyrroline-5-carboxylate dehydrogenase
VDLINAPDFDAHEGVRQLGLEALSARVIVAVQRTGPKAGGPLALSRYAVERAFSVNTAALGGDPQLLEL